MISRWLFGSKHGQSVIDPQFGSKERFVSFLDLVQTLAIREIRRQEKSLTLSKFRQAVETAKDTLNIDFPFARQHCTYLNQNNELVIRPDPERNSFVEVSGKHRGQHLISFVEMYLKRLQFNPEGLAYRYNIFTSQHETPITITMDPHIRFGEPLLPSGYTALNICHAIRVEGGISQAAKAYGIRVEEAEAAYQFVDGLDMKSAARAARRG